MRDTFTFATFLVDQVKASRTQTLVPDLEVVANMGAASIVIEALVGACGCVNGEINHISGQPTVGKHTGQVGFGPFTNDKPFATHRTP